MRIITNYYELMRIDANYCELFELSFLNSDLLLDDKMLIILLSMGMDVILEMFFSMVVSSEIEIKSAAMLAREKEVSPLKFSGRVWSTRISK